MESKAILLCLMLILQLGNSIHVEQCRQEASFTSPNCTKATCQSACQKSWGDDVLHVVCRITGITLETCYCIVCA
uniref:Knottin scorpion toxin-like domain-containing protein n=1 Tax=Aegilops tauschii subsp. strangulata TaxID=200361 RepID=A0A453GXY4_AEGTS